MPKWKIKLTMSPGHDVGGGESHCYWVEGEPSKILWHTQTRTWPGQAMADNCQWHKLRLNMYRGNNKAPQVLTTTRARLEELWGCVNLMVSLFSSYFPTLPQLPFAFLCLGFPHSSPPTKNGSSILQCVPFWVEHDVLLILKICAEFCNGIRTVAMQSPRLYWKLTKHSLFRLERRSQVQVLVCFYI